MNGSARALTGGSARLRLRSIAIRGGRWWSRLHGWSTKIVRELKDNLLGLAGIALYSVFFLGVVIGVGSANDTAWVVVCVVFIGVPTFFVIWAVLGMLQVGCARASGRRCRRCLTATRC
jgi:hypothetical protein